VPESIATYAAPGCTVPQTDFNFGEDVCVVVSNAPPGANERLIWGHTDGRMARETFINSATTSDTLTITPTTVIAGETLDNKGTWRVESVDTDFAPVAVTLFTIHDPDTPTADLTVYKSGPAQVGENSDVSFTLTVANQGPDAAQDVHLVDATPAVTTFVSLTPDAGGPGFTCSGSDCTIASLPKGGQANFTAVYHTNGVVSPTVSSYSATVSSDPSTPPPTAELRPADNSASGEFTINNTVTTSTCTLDCPDNINAIANTTESSVRGAHVTFASAEPSGDCGAVTATPVSGSFFPVGTTTVTVTSETNGGSCSFTVTIEDQGANPPTISCPANPPAANANGDCEAAVAVGTATATGNNVTVFGTRSDGKPMYTCDVNGTNCIRRSSDDTFSSGVTTITWIARSHDVAGPYADADIEEAHRTGAASCTQTVIVNDVTPPVITAVDSTVSADATCQAAVPDYTNSVTDNCSCSANDNSQDCIGQQRITLTQDVAAGTIVGLGPHTIHLTANDGASNPGPDGIPETSDDGTGNVTVKTITFTVADTTSPTVTAPADSSASADASCLAAVPDYVSGSTATDNCSASGSITFSQSPTAGTMVGLGPHTVTVTATDAAGNQGTDTVVFTVNDTTAPTIALTGANPQIVECHTSYPELGATASDNCSGTFAATPSGSVNVNVVGTYTITYNATDGSGNAATPVTRTVIVQDTIAPTITLNGQTPSMWPPNHKYTTFQLTQFVTGASDSCATTLGINDVVIEKVTSDEIENGNGDGNTTNDIVIAANCKSVQLRSEREGDSNGRVYTITFKVSDGFNTTRVTAKVVVPHNPGQTPVDSGVHYTVNGSCP
jgi:uncharacterized repeat protein (TIGR01451 family)